MADRGLLSPDTCGELALISARFVFPTSQTMIGKLAGQPGVCSATRIHYDTSFDNVTGCRRSLPLSARTGRASVRDEPAPLMAAMLVDYAGQQRLLQQEALRARAANPFGSTRFIGLQSIFCMAISSACLHEPSPSEGRRGLVCSFLPPRTHVDSPLVLLYCTAVYTSDCMSRSSPCQGFFRGF